MAKRKFIEDDFFNELMQSRLMLPGPQQESIARQIQKLSGGTLEGYKAVRDQSIDLSGMSQWFQGTSTPLPKTVGEATNALTMSLMPGIATAADMFSNTRKSFSDIVGEVSSRIPEIVVNFKPTSNEKFQFFPYAVSQIVNVSRNMERIKDLSLDAFNNDVGAMNRIAETGTWWSGIRPTATSGFFIKDGSGPLFDINREKGTIRLNPTARVFGKNDHVPSPFVEAPITHGDAFALKKGFAEIGDLKTSLDFVDENWLDVGDQENVRRRRSGVEWMKNRINEVFDGRDKLISKTLLGAFSASTPVQTPVSSVFQPEAGPPIHRPVTSEHLFEQHDQTGFNEEYSTPIDEIMKVHTYVGADPETRPGMEGSLPSLREVVSNGAKTNAPLWDKHDVDNRIRQLKKDFREPEFNGEISGKTSGELFKKFFNNGVRRYKSYLLSMIEDGRNTYTMPELAFNPVPKNTGGGKPGDFAFGGLDNLYPMSDLGGGFAAVSSDNREYGGVSGLTDAAIENEIATTYTDAMNSLGNTYRSGTERMYMRGVQAAAHTANGAPPANFIKQWSGQEPEYGKKQAEEFKQGAAQLNSDAGNTPEAIAIEKAVRNTMNPIQEPVVPEPEGRPMPTSKRAAPSPITNITDPSAEDYVPDLGGEEMYEPTPEDMDALNSGSLHAANPEANASDKTPRPNAVTRNAAKRDHPLRLKGFVADPNKRLGGTRADGTIYVDRRQVALDFDDGFTHLLGGDQKNPVSTQKGIVSQRLGLSPEFLERTITDEKMYARLVEAHEESHKANNDYENYPRTKNISLKTGEGKLDLLNVKAIEIEERAMRDAFRSIGIDLPTSSEDMAASKKYFGETVKNLPEPLAPVKAPPSARKLEEEFINNNSTKDPYTVRYMGGDDVVEIKGNIYNDPNSKWLKVGGSNIAKEGIRGIFDQNGEMFGLDHFNHPSMSGAEPVVEQHDESAQAWEKHVEAASVNKTSLNRKMTEPGAKPVPKSEVPPPNFTPLDEGLSKAPPPEAAARIARQQAAEAEMLKARDVLANDPLYISKYLGARKDHVANWDDHLSSWNSYLKENPEIANAWNTVKSYDDQYGVGGQSAFSPLYDLKSRKKSPAKGASYDPHDLPDIDTIFPPGNSAVPEANAVPQAAGAGGPPSNRPPAAAAAPDDDPEPNKGSSVNRTRRTRKAAVAASAPAASTAPAETSAGAVPEANHAVPPADTGMDDQVLSSSRQGVFTQDGVEYRTNVPGAVSGAENQRSARSGSVNQGQSTGTDGSNIGNRADGFQEAERGVPPSARSVRGRLDAETFGNHWKRGGYDALLRFAPTQDGGTAWEEHDPLGYFKPADPSHPEKGGKFQTWNTDDDNPRTTVSGKTTKAAIKTFETAVEKVARDMENSGELGSLNSKDLASTFHARVRDSITKSVNEQLKHVDQSDPEHAGQLRKEIKQQQSIASQMLSRSSGVNDIVNSAMQPRNEAELDQLRKAFPWIAEKIPNAKAAMSSSEKTIYRGPEGTDEAVQVGGGAGSWLSNASTRLKSIYGTEFGNLMMAQFMGQMAWQKTGGAVLKSAGDWSNAQYRYAGLENYGEGSASGATLAAVRQEQSANQTGRLAYEQYGLFNELGYVAGNLPGGDNIKRAGNDLAVAAGAGVVAGTSAYGIGAVAGALGATALTGAAAATIGLGVATAVGVPALAMTAANAVTGKDSYSGYSFKNWITQDVIQSAASEKDPWSLNFVPLSGGGQTDFVSDKFGVSEEELVKGTKIGNLIGDKNVEWLFGDRTPEAINYRKLATELSEDASITEEEARASLAKGQSYLGALSDPRNARAAKLIGKAAVDQGVDESVIYGAAAEIAGGRGISKYTDEFTDFAAGFASMSPFEQQNYMRAANKEYQRYAQLSPYLAGGNAEAYQLSQQYNIQTMAQVQSLQIGMAGAQSFGGNLSQPAIGQIVTMAPNQANTALSAAAFMTENGVGDYSENALKAAKFIEGHDPLASSLFGEPTVVKETMPTSPKGIAGQSAAAGREDEGIPTTEYKPSSLLSSEQQGRKDLIQGIQSGNKYALSEYGEMSGIGFFQTTDENGLQSGRRDMSGFLNYARQNIGRRPGMGPNTTGVYYSPEAMNMTDSEVLGSLGMSFQHGGSAAESALLTGGTEAYEAFHEKEMNALTMQSLGIQQLGLTQQKQYLWGSGGPANPSANSMWGIQTQANALQWQSQLSNFQYSQQTMDLQYAFQKENAAADKTRMDATIANNRWMQSFDRQTSLIQREFAREDYQFNSQTRALSQGWEAEDMNEKIRRSSGYERAMLIKQRDRQTLSNNRENQQAETQNERQEQMWAREDERYAKGLEYSEKMIALDLERFERTQAQNDLMYKREKEHLEDQIKFATALHALQMKSEELQRDYQAKQIANSQASLALQVTQTQKAQEYATNMRIMSNEQAAWAASVAKFVSYGPGLAEVMQNLIAIMDILAKVPTTGPTRLP